MSHVAVWTDANNRVKRKHFRVDKVDTSDAAVVIDGADIPAEPDVADWVEVTQHYSESNGFYYETDDPLDGLQMSESQKQRLYDAFTNNDIVEARNIVEEALQA